MADLPSTPPAPTPAAVVAPAPAAAEPIYVDSGAYRYSVTGNTLLPRATVEAVIRGAATPKEAIDALNQAYVDAGYFLVVIGGRVEKQLVALQVVQGRIAELDAPPDLVPYFRRTVNREDLTRNMLLRDSAMADLYAARQGVRLKASYSPAQAVGGTRLTFEEEPIEGAKPWTAALSFSNLSGRFASRYTWGASGSVRPGGGLELTAAYNQGIPGLTSASAGSTYRSGTLGASVVTPWGLYALNYSDTQYQIGESGAPFFPFGSSEFGGVSGTQLVYTDATNRLVTTEGLNRYSVRQAVDITPTDRIFLVKQDYTVVSAGVTYTSSFALAGRNSALSATVNAAKGLSAPTGTFLPRDPGTPDPRFLLVQANATASAGLPQGFSAAATITTQYSDVSLPQAQQWILGGFGNLTAWLPAAIVGDSGALVRATLNAPARQWGVFSYSGNVFAEGGISRADQRGDGEPYTRGLADVGFSLSGSTTTGTSLTVAFAQPVWYRNVEGAVREAVDRNRAYVYFTLNQSF